MTLALRLVVAVGAGFGAAVAMAVVYAIVDLYLAGHSIPVPTVLGRPLHAALAQVLVVVVPLAVAVIVFWSRRPSARGRRCRTGPAIAAASDPPPPR